MQPVGHSYGGAVAVGSGIAGLAAVRVLDLRGTPWARSNGTAASRRTVWTSACLIMSWGAGQVGDAVALAIIR